MLNAIASSSRKPIVASCRSCKQRWFSTSPPLAVFRPQEHYEMPKPFIDSYGKPQQLMLRNKAGRDPKAIERAQDQMDALKVLAEPRARSWYERYGSHEGFGLRNKPRYRENAQGKLEEWAAAGANWKYAVGFYNHQNARFGVPGFQRKGTPLLGWDGRIIPDQFFGRKNGGKKLKKTTSGQNQPIITDRPEHLVEEPDFSPIERMARTPGRLELERQAPPHAGDGAEPSAPRTIAVETPARKLEAREDMFSQRPVELPPRDFGGGNRRSWADRDEIAVRQEPTEQRSARLTFGATRGPSRQVRPSPNPSPNGFRGSNAPRAVNSGMRQYSTQRMALRPERSRPQARQAVETLSAGVSKSNPRRPWVPTKKLSYSAMAGLRALYQTDPTKYDRPFLAVQFGVSQQAVSRILKSTWRDSSKHQQGHSINLDEVMPITARRARGDRQEERSITGTKWDVNPETSPSHSPVPAILRTRQ